MSGWRTASDGTVVRLAKTLRAEGRLRVLDIGCGDGRNALYLDGQGLEVAGIDWSPRMIQAARDRAAAAGRDQVQFHEGRPSLLPFPDGLFDAVLSQDLLSRLLRPELEEAIAEIRRVLSPGGHLQVLVLSTDDELYGLGEEIEPGTFSYRGSTCHFFRRRELETLFGTYQIGSLVHLKMLDPVQRPSRAHCYWLLEGRK